MVTMKWMTYYINNTTPYRHLLWYTPAKCYLLLHATCLTFSPSPYLSLFFSLYKTQIHDLNFTVPGLMDMVSSVTIEEGKFQNKYFTPEFSQTSKMKSSQPKKKARVNNRIHI